MEKQDLSLVPLDDLLTEVESRVKCLVLGYSLPDDSQNSYYKWGKGWRNEALGISSDLNNNVLNNWNGELKTLQKLHDEEES